MFRRNISPHGPNTRSKRWRSSLTHFNGPRATTVAALGRFKTSAISPINRKEIQNFNLTQLQANHKRIFS